jgi:hypothetical protein
MIPLAGKKRVLLFLRRKLSRPRLVTALGVLSREFAALVSEILGEEPERADRPQ